MSNTYKETRKAGKIIHQFMNKPLDAQEAQERVEEALAEDIHDLMSLLGVGDLPMEGLYLDTKQGAVTATFNSADDSPRRLRLVLDYAVIASEADRQKYLDKLKER